MDRTFAVGSGMAVPAIDSRTSRRPHPAAGEGAFHS
jgi:hypothetical protein